MASCARIPVFAHGAFEPRFRRLLKRASGDLTDFDRLHRLRIEGKKVRYAMELLVSGFPKTFQTKLYPQVEELQDKRKGLEESILLLNREKASTDAETEQLRKMLEH